MRILHFSLGLPPYRSGGLTKYATDLMKEQVRQGNRVSILYPGGIRLIEKTRIKKMKEVDGIDTYEIANPLPVPLYHGINKPSDFIPRYDNTAIYGRLLDNVKAEVLHIHTLMGLSIGLLKAARQRNIKIVFTTHDFFGLCMKCTFIDINDKLCGNPSPQRCAWCNQNAKSLAFLRFRNQPIVITIKNKLHKSYQDGHSNKMDVIGIEQFTSKKEDYAQLMEYYKSLFAYIDMFHFNSSVTETIYRNYLRDIEGKVIPITNSDIRDNRNKGFYCGKTLKMVFVGHTDAFKGFPLLKSVLLELQQYDWQLDVWGVNEGVDPDTNKIRYRGRYTKDDLTSIYADCTIAIVPSQWFETFSFVTLEALSYGVPVLVSDHVGAKTIVAEYAPSFIFMTREELKSKLERIMKDRTSVIDYHHKILSKPWHHDMAEHCKEIIEKIYK